MRPTALVTGASAGIGLAIARELALRGFDLVLVARREDKLNELAKQLEKRVNITVIALDLAEAGAPQQLFDALKGIKIDLLVNNAGLGAYGFFAETDPAKVGAMLHVNIVALTALTQLFLPGMIERRCGRILNVASVAAYFAGPLMAVYYASKAYVLSFSEALSNEVAGSGVTVTCLNPGPTISEFQEQAGMGELTTGILGYMSSRKVARIGIRATLRGERVCTPGLLNKALVLLTHLVPRGALLALMRLFQQEKHAR
jgi:short-subunit dehydrogenase